MSLMFADGISALSAHAISAYGVDCRNKYHVDCINSEELLIHLLHISLACNFKYNDNLALQQQSNLNMYTSLKQFE